MSNLIRRGERESIVRERVREYRRIVAEYEARILALQGALDVGAALEDDEVYNVLWREAMDAGKAARQMMEQGAVNGDASPEP